MIAAQSHLPDEESYGRSKIWETIGTRLTGNL